MKEGERLEVFSSSSTICDVLFVSNRERHWLYVKFEIGQSGERECEEVESRRTLNKQFNEEMAHERFALYTFSHSPYTTPYDR